MSCVPLGLPSIVRPSSAWTASPLAGTRSIATAPGGGLSKVVRHQGTGLCNGREHSGRRSGTCRDLPDGRRSRRGANETVIRRSATRPISVYRRSRRPLRGRRSRRCWWISPPTATRRAQVFRDRAEARGCYERSCLPVGECGSDDALDKRGTFPLRLRASRTGSVHRIACRELLAPLRQAPWRTRAWSPRLKPATSSPGNKVTASADRPRDRVMTTQALTTER